MHWKGRGRCQQRLGRRLEEGGKKGRSGCYWFLMWGGAGKGGRKGEKSVAGLQAQPTEEGPRGARLAYDAPMILGGEGSPFYLGGGLLAQYQGHQHVGLHQQKRRDMIRCAVSTK